MSAPGRIAGVLRKAVLVSVAVLLVSGAGWGVWHWQANGKQSGIVLAQNADVSGYARSQNGNTCNYRLRQHVRATLRS